MVNAGRILIIPKGTWSNLQNYEMLDLVSLDGVAYLARAASVGQNPSTDISMTYWQPFGTASEIATTSEPGLVMPDGQTITIDATGLIQANLGISDLNNVTITSIANGQILVYDSTAGAWKNANISVSAGDVNYNNQTSGMTATKVQAAIDELSSDNQTLTNTKADQSLLAPIQTTLVASKAYAIGEQFVYQGLLYKATAAITQGGTITINGNCALSDDVTSQIDKISKTETVTISNLSGYFDSFSGFKRNKIVNFKASTKNNLPASTWITLGTMNVIPESAQALTGLITSGTGQTAIVNITSDGKLQIFASSAGAYNVSGSFICK